MSYDDKDYSGFPINTQKYNYLSVNSEDNSKYFDNENIKEGDSANNNNIKYGIYSTKREKSKYIDNKNMDKNEIYSPSNNNKSSNNLGLRSKTFQRKYKYNDGNMLIIPKHEEQFNIIDNKENYLSPKGNKNINNEIALTPINKIQNWNKINEHVKNEEISYKNKDKSELSKIIDDKENKINLLQEKLKEIKNSVNKQKIFKNNLEINNGLNEINIKGIKSQYLQLDNLESKRMMSPKTFSRLEPEGINNNRFKV